MVQFSSILQTQQKWKWIKSDSFSFLWRSKLGGFSLLVYIYLVSI